MNMHGSALAGAEGRRAGAGGLGEASRVVIIYEKWLVRVARLVSRSKSGGNQPFFANHPVSSRVVS